MPRPAAPQAVPRRRGLLAAALFTVVFAVFAPAGWHDFICYDDNGYVYDNAWVKQGFTADGVRQAFRTTEIAYWHPLTWLSHMADVELFGLKPGGHHLVNVFWHALNTVLVFLVFRRLTGATWRSALVAALFGLHPLHVESVAWVAERKDVLSTFFLLLAIGSYASWVQGGAAGRPRRAGFYLLSLLAFAGGLMCKPMVVTLPCVLLLFDCWPLNRWGPHTANMRLATLGRLVAEKLPFFALSAAGSAAAVVAQARLGTLQSTAALPLADRSANALAAYAGYLGKCFWPADLAIFYPYPKEPPVGAAVAAALLLAAITGLAVIARKSRPWLPVGWLFFLGTLVPVIGFVQVGAQAMADRYSYVPLLGVFLMLAWGAADLAQRRPRWQPGLVAVAVALLAGLAVLTARQLTHWRNSLAVFSHALAVTPENWAAHSCLGYYFATQPGREADSIAQYRAMLAIAPRSVEGHYSLGAVLARNPATLAEAVAQYQAALALDPRYVRARFALAKALRQLPGRTGEAMALLEKLTQEEPDNPAAWNELADLLAEDPARLPAAIAAYRNTLRLRPDWVEARSNLGMALAQIPERLPEAVAEYRIVLQARPAEALVHANLANAFVRMERYDEAEAEYRTALRFQPDYYFAEMNLGILLASLPGRETEAVVHLENALRLEPNLTPARQMLEQLRTVERK